MTSCIISYLPLYIQRTEEKVRAIMDADTPRDVKAIRSFLGLIMFYSKFLENHSTVLAPLNKLLCKDVPWNWAENHDTAFLAAMYRINFEICSCPMTMK